jgi:large subunit GTPase 1
MPRNQGTSRKGKPKKLDREAGMGRALTKTQKVKFTPKSNGSSRGAGMHMAPGTSSINILDDTAEKKVKSILEMDDLTDFLGQAELANREFLSEREQFVVLDDRGSEYKKDLDYKTTWADQPQENNDTFVFKELSVPRRPAWDESMSVDELNKQEADAFLAWRRAIASREEQLLHDHGARVTPFEKNLEVWRQLWRVMERCSCILQIVDARNPLFYLSSDLRSYATEELGKPMLLLINKSDFLSEKQRQAWHEYFNEQGWDHLFFSAHMEQAKLDEAAAAERHEEEVPEDDDRYDTYNMPAVEEDDDDDDDASDDESIEEVDPAEEPQEKKPVDEVSEASAADLAAARQNIGIKNPLTRIELLNWLQAFAVQYKCDPDPRFHNKIQFGMVGFPNVGKSSVINVLVGAAKHAHGVVRVAVAAQPGKTKHFQTLFLPDRDDVMLCDCPGLVFPSFVSSAADMIAAGVFPIAQMRDHWPVVGLICKRIPREILNAQYGFKLPYSKEHLDPNTVPTPTAEELLTTYCIARSMIAASSGIPDYQMAARLVVKDYAAGKLLFCHAPPTANAASFQRETILLALSRTKKLREKFETVIEEEQHRQEQNPEDNSADEDNESEDDLDLLEFMDGVGGGVQEKANGGKRGHAHKTMHKHGKKGRKLRNKDPYGCHSTPDDTLGGNTVSNGAVVKAGKYSRAGYTRPTSYAGARGVTEFENRSTVEKAVVS